MKYRNHLPQLDGGLFLTDGGIETSLIFDDGFDLPHFAAFHLLREDRGREGLRRYYERYLPIAISDGTGFLLESPTWRASKDWGEKLGYSSNEIWEANKDAIGLMMELREAHETSTTPIVISGCVGPRGDGYDPGQIMSAREAETYHTHQIHALGEAGVEMITGITMTNSSEAIGVTRAAQKAGVPVAISFTVETDGRLPTGQTLREAIEQVDAETANGPAYYMINCAHPTHFDETLTGSETWLQRIRGIRANASKRSHQELNDIPDLDSGDPIELGNQYRDLLRRNPYINVLGGCCGTDQRHVRSICEACHRL
jgi:S-methylmethionine-dependent homocysteine/selenocysteine methylase